MHLLYIIALHVAVYGSILFINVLTDKDAVTIPHTKEAIIRFACLLLNLFILYLLTHLSIVLLIKLLVLECAIWWIVFDIWLNDERGQVPFHVGGAWIDKQFLKLNYGDYWIIATKFFILGATLWSLL